MLVTAYQSLFQTLFALLCLKDLALIPEYYDWQANMYMLF